MSLNYRGWLRSAHAVSRAVTQSLDFTRNPARGDLIKSGTPVILRSGGGGVVASGQEAVNEGDRIGLTVSDRVWYSGKLNVAVLTHGIVNYNELSEAAQNLLRNHRSEFTLVGESVISPYNREYQATY